MGAQIEKKLGKNGKVYIIVGFIALFVIMYLRQSSGSTTKVALTDDADNSDLVAVNGAYASYPDSVTNADTIISSLQDSIDYAMTDLKETYDSKLQEQSDALSKQNDLLKEAQSTIDELKKQNTIASGSQSNTDVISQPSHNYGDYNYNSTNTSNMESVHRDAGYIDMVNQLKDKGLYNSVGASGMTIGQQVGMLGTDYMGSKVKSTSQTSSGLIVETTDGKRYLNGKLQS